MERNNKWVSFTKIRLNHDCATAEEVTIDEEFVKTISYPPLLKFSPAEQLLRGYYPDGVGQSVIDSHRKSALYEQDEDSRGGTPKKRTPRKVSRNRFFPVRKTRKDSVSGKKEPFSGACRHIRPVSQFYSY